MLKRAAEPSRRAANVTAQEIAEPDILYGTGATEPGDPDNLAELNDKSAGVGTWVLNLYGMHHQTYEKQKEKNSNAYFWQPMAIVVRV